MVILEFVRVDVAGDIIKVNVDDDVICGRGPLFGVDSTNISRKHVKIRWDGKMVFLTCLHRNPVFVEKSASDWHELNKAQEIVIEEGDKIKFTDEFIFNLVSIIIPDNKPRHIFVNNETVKKDIIVNTEEVKKNIIVNADDVKKDKEDIDNGRDTINYHDGNKIDIEVTPKPTGLKVKRKRKLPDWMMEVHTPDKKTPIKKTPTKKIPISEKYQITNEIKKSFATDYNTSMSEKVQSHYEENIKFITGRNTYINTTIGDSKDDDYHKYDFDKVDNKDKKLFSEDVQREHSKVNNDLTDLQSVSLTREQSTFKRSPTITFPQSEDNDRVMLLPSEVCTRKHSNVQDHFHDLSTSKPSTSSIRTPDLTVPQPEDNDDNTKPFTFPVLVSPDDLIDSDDDHDKENINKNKLTTATKIIKRPSCQYGSSCYRKNPLHRLEEAHLGDSDYRSPNNDDNDDERPECEYGTDCYRQNPDHRKDFKHSHKPQLKRKAKAKGLKKKKEDDDLDDSFIDDTDDEEPIDDTDEDEDWQVTDDDD